MKRKLKLALPITAALVAAAAVYQFALASPSESHGKVEGEVYVLPKEFVLNLAGGRYAKLTVALVLGHGQEIAEAPEAEGFGGLDQEALVRQIVTDELTGAPAQVLTSPQGRQRYESRIERAIERDTDVEASAVAFTDLVVQ